MTDGAGLEIDFGLHIGAAVGQAVAEALAADRGAERARRRELNGQIMPLSVDLMPIPMSAGAGVLDQPRLLGPGMGWTYQLDAMGAQGFSAGSVGVFVNSVLGAQVFNFTAAGTFYSRHFRYLRYGERLVFQATGITGAPAVWIAGLAFMDIIQGEVLT
jgi:hypothetical protein